MIGRLGAAALAIWCVAGVIGAALIAGAGAIAWSGSLPPGLPRGDLSLERWDQGIVTASGSWSQPGMPGVVQTTEILCRLDTGYCVEGQGAFALGTLNAKAAIGQITRWDKDMILFLDDEPCMSFNYRITRNPAAVTLARRTKVNRVGCESVEKADANLTLATDPAVLPKHSAGNAATILAATLGGLALWTAFVLWGAIRTARA